jgi:4-amino-4-deoxy-L-arabinose transferase-like glycosyltransferase
MNNLQPLFRKIINLASGVLLILAGILLFRNGIQLPAWLVLVSGMGIFVSTMLDLEKIQPGPDELASIRPLVVPVFLWASVIGLNMVAIDGVANANKPGSNTYLADFSWFLGIIICLVILVHGQGKLPRLVEFIEQLKANRRELLLVLGIGLLAFGLRIFDLPWHPYPWSGDEASIGSEAGRILQGQVTNFFNTGWSGQPNWSFVPTAISITVLGNNILAVRLISALAGTMAVLAVYLVTREMFDTKTGLIAATFLAAMPYHLHFSRIGVHNVIDTFNSSLMFWLVLRAIKTEHWSGFLRTGLFGGLCFYTYVGSRIVPILGLTVLAWHFIQQHPKIIEIARKSGIFLLGFIAASAPMLFFFAQHPDSFMTRINQEGILQNGWLISEAARTGQSIWTILYSQFSRTFLVYIANPAFTFFFYSPRPLLTVLGAIFFLIGMGLALGRAFKLPFFIVLLWYWSIVILAGVLTLNPPAITRLMMTSPAVAILLAIGLAKTTGVLEKLKILSPRWGNIAITGVLFILTVQNVTFYMGEYRQNYYFQDSISEIGMEAGLISRRLSPETIIYMIGAPYISAGFPTIVFCAPQNPKFDLNPEDVSSLALESGQKVVFFAIPAYFDNLQYIINNFPGGKEGLVYRKPNPQEILFKYYILTVQ